MAIAKFFDRNNIQYWKFDTTLGGVNRNTISGNFYINNEIFNDPNTPIQDKYLYNQDKNYQFTTKVVGLNPMYSPISIKFSAPFKDSIVATTRVNQTATSSVIFYTYANPSNTEYSKDIIKYSAPQTFTTSAITESKLNEINFLINGYREFKYLNIPFNHINQPNGWCYEEPNNTINNNIPSYTWYNSTASNISPTYSTFGSGLKSIFKRPYIAKIIDYDIFNIDFHIDFVGSGRVDLYMVNQNSLNTNSWGTPFITATNSGTYSQINKISTNDDGTKNYLVFEAYPSTTSTYNVSLSNINISGGYHPINNTQIFASYSTTDISVNSYPDMLYTFTTISNGITYSLPSRIGNGLFNSGIWENGVWNNGWRDDTKSKDFDDVYSSILYAYDVSWEIKIKGTIESCNSFEIGDKVSIGNIVAIDINENRKLIKDYYTIIEIGEDFITEGNNTTTINWVKVRVNTTFPYRRIEKDSPNHKIKITKNVWLSGAFFNGYFSGVWNYGLFKGYPKITEMFNTHWIDGIFNGGHFNSKYPTYEFTNVEPTVDCTIRNITLIFGNGHGLLLGDYITITMTNDVLSNGNISQNISNPTYNGFAKVLKIDGNNITVNKQIVFSTLNGTRQTGYVTRYTSSGVIQNFNFYDTNISKLKSSQSNISTNVFKFNSWIDTNYDNTRSVTIGRDFRSYEKLTGKSINKNNLFGYPTYDVLSSAARFRNSFDLNYGLYKLGTKYKVFNDFIGEGSDFNEPFNDINFKPFYDMGWTYSTIDKDDIQIKRSEVIIAPNDDISQNYIDSGVTGEELWTLSRNTGMVLNNDNISFKKSRYSVIEFDVITHSTILSGNTQENYYYTFENPTASNTNVEPLVSIPILHFSNLNYDITSYAKTLEDYDFDDYSLDYSFDIYDEHIYKKMSFLPVSENISHLQVQNTFRLDSIEKTSAERYEGYGKNQKTKKYEYFYNKTDLMMSVNGNGTTGINNSMMIFDNIKMFEVDMIPFFQYFEYSNIYKGIQIPYEGVAPDIDYLNSDFIFIDNITIGLDTINTSIFDNITPVCIPPVYIPLSVTVTTNTPTSITYDSITANGSYVIGGNNITISNRGFCYVLDSAIGEPVHPTNDYFYSASSTTTFTANTTTLLSQNTKYKLRAFVIDNTSIVYYGNTVTFTTLTQPTQIKISFSLDNSGLVDTTISFDNITSITYTGLPGSTSNFSNNYIIVSPDPGYLFININDINVTFQGGIIVATKQLVGNDIKITFTESSWPSSDETIIIEILGSATPIPPIIPTITIGTQEWTSTNLDVTTYRDGTPIPEVTDDTTWANLTTGAWCYYDNNTINGPIYGKLYNWYAVAGIYDAASLANPSLRKELAPTGFHIPSNTEWTTLTTFLGGIGASPIPLVGGKMKSTGTTLWKIPNTGANNSSLFTGLPGGNRFDGTGTFLWVHDYGFWWTSSEIDPTQAWSRYLNYNFNYVYIGSGDKQRGFSVRCIKD